MAGLSGLLGALLFFSGDMLFYGYVGSGAGFPAGMLATVATDSSTRLSVGGLLGMPAACLCIVGFWHVRGNVKHSSPFLRELIFLSFAAMMVAGSAIHTLWAAKGLAIKYCSDGSAPCSAVTAALRSYWSVAYNIGSAPGYVGAVLLVLLVAFGKTRYPKWTVLANPAILLLLSPLADATPAPVGAILVGGFTNLTIAVFFLASLVTTWHLPPDSPSARAT
jgi:hypothetical protein